jgi:hypothetical protein
LKSTHSPTRLGGLRLLLLLGLSKLALLLSPLIGLRVVFVDYIVLSVVLGLIA